KYFGARVFFNWLVTDFSISFEIAESPCSTGMNNPLRNFFTVEMRDFFYEMIVFQCSRTSVAHSPDILIVFYRMALPGRQSFFIFSRSHFPVQFFIVFLHTESSF